MGCASSKKKQKQMEIGGDLCNKDSDDQRSFPKQTYIHTLKLMTTLL